MILRPASSNRLDAAVPDDDGLVCARRRTSTVDHPNVGQRHDGRVNLDEAANGVAELCLGGEQYRDGRREAKRHGKSSHHYHVQLPDGGGHRPMICRRMMTCPR
jgi:hypothetical protein